MNRHVLWTAVGLATVCAGCGPRRPEPVSLATETPRQAVAPPAAARQYSYGYWLNGWRKAPEDTSSDVLCFETGHYGFMLDMDDLVNPRFGVLDDEVDYRGALAATDRVDALEPAQLIVELEAGGKTYRVVTCRAGTESGVGRLKTARLWWAGRFAQEFELQGLTYEDETGRQLQSYANLRLVAWPGSLSLTAELQPDFVCGDGPVGGVVGNGLSIMSKPVDVPHSPELEPEHLTLECWVKMTPAMDRGIYGWLVCKNDHELGLGNYGFMFLSGAVHAVLNTSGAAAGRHSIRQRGFFSPGEWHHLALTFDGQTMVHYMDGNEQGRKEVGEPRTPGSGDLRIGQRADGVLGVVNGFYDQIRVWSRVLSADEIAAHAARPAELSSREGLVLDKSFDEGGATEPPAFSDARVRMSLTTAQGEWQAEERVEGPWQMGDMKTFSLNCDLPASGSASRAVTGSVSTPSGQTFPVRFDAAKNCYMAEIRGLQRSFNGGYVKITDYDDFDILIDCADDASKPVPFLLQQHDVANITGLVPVLCRDDGTPTGIPVQLSKNWHNPQSNGLRAFTLLPVAKGANRFRLRVAYGFYGTLPSASHAQLSLVGWGANGRWDQLALGSGGESITFDMDMSATAQAVCDVRLPLGRKGKEGNPWGWTEAGWGGDWLGLYDAKTNKLAFAGLKTAYLAHGPCLTDVIYKGAYGADRGALLDARVQSPRSDDYGRTFQKLEYRFQEEFDARNTFLLRRHPHLYDEAVAYGNANGLIAETRVEGDLKNGDLLIPPTEMAGPGPWWIALPGRTYRGHAPGAGGIGYISLILRDYQASFGGQASPNPYLTVRVALREENEAKLEILLVPPPSVKSYKPGDRVLLDTEWVHLHRIADDYAGLNKPYLEHLAANPRSWKTTYREVTGNDLTLAVTGGTLTQTLPIVIQVSAPEVSVDITGGLGFVPIRFEGLATVDGYALYETVDGKARKLDQSVHGNDFWQTDLDTDTGRYNLSFNIPLDGKPTSRWVLRQVAVGEQEGTP